MRLHTRSIIRDGTWAFVGSQSLRALELDSRREVGIIFRDPKVVARLAKTFEDDWEAKAAGGTAAFSRQNRGAGTGLRCKGGEEGGEGRGGRHGSRETGF